MLTWIDAHNHLQDSRIGDVAAVLRTMKSGGISRCIVNATQEADWPAVEELACAEPRFIVPAFGIHPWHAHTATVGWQDRLTKLLQKIPHASIGECGLDSWIEQPVLEIQLPIFTEQLRLAREMDRALTIHCLKAWGSLFEAFSISPPPRHFLMHSFGGSIEIARRLMPLGAYFSFSGYFLHAKKLAALDVYRQLPLERVLLETDAPDMLPPKQQQAHRLTGNHNHPANLAAIATSFAYALGISPESLAEATNANTVRCFGLP